MDQLNPTPQSQAPAAQPAASDWVPNDLVWAPITESAGARPPQPQSDIPNDLSWEPLGKQQEKQPDDWHVAKAITRGFLRMWGESTGDRPEEIEAREKTLGISGTGDKAAEFAGGVLAPQPGVASKAGGTLAAARFADKAKKTLGQITGSEILKKIERSLTRLPGGEVLSHALKHQTEMLGDETADLVDRLSKGGDTSAIGTGNVVRQQLKEAGKRMRREAGSDYEEVAKLVPPERPIGVKQTLTVLRELTAPIPQAENVSSKIIDPTINSMREELEKDLAAQNMDALPFGALKALRTKIGKMIVRGPFGTDARNGQLKQVYEAMTADMNTGAAGVSDAAAAAVKKANAAYFANAELGRTLKTVVDKEGGAERLFGAILSGSPSQGTTVLKVLNQLDGPSRQLLAASALQRMGRAAPGMQNAAGDAFSVASFLTNWNKMARNPQVKDALFGQLPGDYAKSITQLSTNVDALKTYENILVNPSGTAHTALWAGGVALTMQALITGNFAEAGTIVATAAGNAALGAALTNPKTAAWLAKRTSNLVISAAKGEMGVTPQSHQAWITRQARQGAEQHAVEQFEESLGL